MVIILWTLLRVCFSGSMIFYLSGPVSLHNRNCALWKRVSEFAGLCFVSKCLPFSLGITITRSLTWIMLLDIWKAR